MERNAVAQRGAAHFLPPAPATITPRAVLEIQVHLLSTQGEFSSIAADWERLHAEAAVASVFNSWLWQYAWWDLYGRAQPLRILVASRGSAVVGILPLYVQTVTMLGLPVRRLRLLGDGGDTHPDDLGPLLARGMEPLAAAALADAALRLKGFDVIEFSDIDSRSPFPPAMVAAARQAQLDCSLGRSERIAYIELPPDWNAYVAAEGVRRRSADNLRRKLAAKHPARFFVWQDAATLDRALARLAELHRKRWAGASESFVTRDYMDLHRAAMRECLQRDWLRLYCLEIAGEIAAMTYCYRFRKHVFMMQAGFDPAYGKFSPGSILLGHALEHAIGEGNRVFDFLRGEHGYKDQLATGNRETVGVTAFRPTLGATTYRAKCTLQRTLRSR